MKELLRAGLSRNEGRGAKAAQKIAQRLDGSQTRPRDSDSSGYYVRMRRSAHARKPWLSRFSRHAWPLWLVTASLVLGLAPLHSSTEGLGQHGALDGPTRVWLADCQPGRARHIEPATPVELPRCMACVLQLQTIGAAIPAQGQPVGLALVGDAVAATRELPAAPLRRLPASRGPPLA